MTKKIYNQPEVQVAQFESSSLMNPGSPNIQMNQGSTIDPTQW